MRDSLASREYWNEWADFSAKNIALDLAQIDIPSGNPTYRPQFVWDTSMEHLRLILRKYSRGDRVQDLLPLLIGVIDTWELSNSLAKDVCANNNLKTCRDWVFELGDLNHYIWCFWVVSLALLFSISDEYWARLLRLVGNPGADIVLDKVIATRQKDWNVGSVVLHKKPYVRLLEALSAPESQRPRCLFNFLENWYVELNRKGKQQPWWYLYGDPEKNPIELGSYFGRWCLEAAVCAKVFGIDDSEMLRHANYPGDLLRPGAPSAHVSREKIIRKRWFDIFRK